MFSTLRFRQMDKKSREAGSIAAYQEQWNRFFGEGGVVVGGVVVVSGRKEGWRWQRGRRSIEL